MPLKTGTLTGRWVQLEPLNETHRSAMRTAADDERAWEFTLTLGHGPYFDAWFDDALAQQAAGSRAPFAVRRLSDGEVIGSTSYLDAALVHPRIEIGSTWYRVDLWGTAINPECKRLLLQHAFDVLHVKRVALVTDGLNLRSQAAIAKLGAVREGVLRHHMVTQSGRVRDSVIFSILSAEWPAARERLLARLATWADRAASSD